MEMDTLRLDRLEFCFVAPVFVALKLALFYFVVAANPPVRFVQSLDLAIVSLLAVAVGMRFVDFGSTRLVGGGATYLLAYVPGNALFLGYLWLRSPPKSEVISFALPSVGIISLLLLAGFLIWAGMQPTVRLKKRTKRATSAGRANPTDRRAQ